MVSFKVFGVLKKYKFGRDTYLVVVPHGVTLVSKPLMRNTVPKQKL